MLKSVALHTLGCKLNYSETSTIEGNFRERGFAVNEFGKGSDIFVLNTCSVTDNADKECRQIIRSVLRNKPDTYVIITGCYAQLQPQEIAAIHGVDLVLGANEKFKLFDYIDNFEKKELSCVFTSPIDEVTGFDYAYSTDSDSRTRAFLKIQDGCDYNCSFCTIPKARGGSRSLAIDKVIDNAKRLLDTGYQEIVLTGVNTGDYNYSISSGSDLTSYKLLDVLLELEKINVPRIRISSIEPNLVTDEIIALVKSSANFCKHFHVPLQSGDPDVLKLMRRRYNRDFYENLIYKLRSELPQAGIGVDVIVGFPGETDLRFANTTAFIDSLPISYLHVFSYSERKNTPAAEMAGSVEISERKRRSAVLRELSNKKKLEFYLSHLGNIREVLFETAKDDGSIYGFTDNYIKMKAAGGITMENKILKARISKVESFSFAEAEVIS
jgi:threonylcarbamoyladenosine tRNA methylthiotransferase MtaB